MGNDVTRILLVDDQVLYREALRGLIDRWDEFEVIGEASDGKEAIDLALSLEPDLILMDIRMPGMDGITAAQAVLTHKPDLPIVMLTVEADASRVFDSLQIGVRGYLLKDTPARKLRDRLRAVMQGEATLSESVTGSVFDEFARLRLGDACTVPDMGRRPTWHGSDQLTAREKDVLRLVAQGKSNEDIASELYLSLGTVKKQISAIMMRLGLDNRVQLAVYAVRAGLDKSTHS